MLLYVRLCVSLYIINKSKIDRCDVVYKGWCDGNNPVTNPMALIQRTSNKTAVAEPPFILLDPDTGSGPMTGFNTLKLLSYNDTSSNCLATSRKVFSLLNFSIGWLRASSTGLNPITAAPNSFLCFTSLFKLSI